MVMRVFVAGGSGVMGRRLVPQLVARGHQVTATTTSPAKLGLLEQLGADAIVMDGLDAVSVGEAVAEARPDAIVHQMTAISVAHAGKPDMKHMDRWFATTDRLRTEGTDHLLAAAEATGVSNFVAQSYASWNGIRKGGWVKTEEDPLDPETGRARPGAVAIRHLEGRKATDPGPQVAGPAAGRASGGDDDDRGARLLQRQGQAGARMGAALPLVAQGFQGRARVTRAEDMSRGKKGAWMSFSRFGCN
jgi:NAD(P)H-binding